MSLFAGGMVPELKRLARFQGTDPLGEERKETVCQRKQNKKECRYRARPCSFIMQIYIYVCVCV